MADSRWGQARIEVIAVKELVTQRLEAGHSLKSIWADLRGAGQVTVAYTNFRIQFQEHGKTKETPPVSRATTALPPKPGIAERPAPIPRRESGTTISQFHHNPVAQRLVLTPAGENADSRERDDNAD